jgi:anti-sigma regulatory factor (Ser/Thr protein kinase)
VSPSARNVYELRATLAAAPAEIEEFILDFRRQAESHLPRPQRFAAELLVREALNNAAVHGCRSDPRKRFRCVLRLESGRLTIAVEDGGDGFDWRATLRRHAAASDDSGRGLGILLSYATRVRFNHAGNAVTIVKRF